MSILEIIIVLSIFTIATAFTLPYTVTLVNKTRTDSEARKLTYALFRQQQDSYAGLDNTSYGIAFFSDRYVVFSGDSYSSATYEFAYPLNESVRISSVNLDSGSEIVFPKNSIYPNTVGNIRFSDSISEYSVSINAEGLISYDEIQ